MLEKLFLETELVKFDFFLDLVEQDKLVNKYKGGRKPTISTKYYLDKILVILFTGQSWPDLQIYDHVCHFTAVYKKYVLWVNKGFFDNFHVVLLNLYLDLKIRNRLPNVTFVDSTDIQNSNGSKKLTGFGRKFKNKRAIRLHTFCDENRVTLSALITPANIMDVTQLQPLINQIFVPIEPQYRNPDYIVGDKGYISKDTYTKLRKQNRILTYPLRKNQVGKTSKYKKTILKKRVTIEHSYNSFKRTYKRLNKFNERNPKNYLTFVKIANSIILTNLINDYIANNMDEINNKLNNNL